MKITLKGSDIKKILTKLSGLDDFNVELLNVTNKKYYARYFIRKRLIRIYAKDKNGGIYNDDELILTAIHELAHHILWYHTPGWERKMGVAHGEEFYSVYNRLLNAHVSSIPLKAVRS